MGRGKASKSARQHQRAIDAGRSTRGCSNTANRQRGGKKYGKGEMNTAKDEPNSGVKYGVYEGINYVIQYALIDGMIEVERICRLPTNCAAMSVKQVKEFKVKDPELAMKIAMEVFGK